MIVTLLGVFGKSTCIYKGTLNRLQVLRYNNETIVLCLIIHYSYVINTYGDVHCVAILFGDFDDFHKCRWQVVFDIVQVVSERYIFPIIFQKQFGNQRRRKNNRHVYDTTHYNTSSSRSGVAMRIGFHWKT